MKSYSFLFILLFTAASLLAQPFVEIQSGLPAIGRSAVAFADFDNDRDLDLVMLGLDNASNTIGKVFLNQQGNFVEIVSGIEGLYNSAIAVADYDQDGWMDVVMTGQDETGNATRLYKNTGNGIFTLIPAGFYPAGTDGDLAWGDYNNDGFPDLIVSGGWDTRLYRNNGNGTFEEVNAGLALMNSPSVDWGDCDNDGDLDLLMVGDAGSVGETFVYINENGTFSRLDVMIEGAVGGMASWGDYDNDGNLDILITGKDATLSPVSFVYWNNGSNSFRFSDAGLVGTALGPANWIDYDNDGDLDIMLAGQNAGCGNASTRLYTNSGVGSFDEFGAGFPFVERASSAWGDFDNDGDYDLLLSGISNGAVTKLFRNDILTGTFQQNTPPQTPSDPDTYVSGEYAVLSWSRSTDLQSPQMAISYNVMLGTQPGAIDIVSPMANLMSGERFEAAIGNAGNNDFMIFRSLSPGNYYFRIQAIDQAFTGSGFSEERSFTIVNTKAENEPMLAVKAYITDNRLVVERASSSDAEVSVFNVSGMLLFKCRINSPFSSLPFATYQSGIYLVCITENGFTTRTKLIK